MSIEAGVGAAEGVELEVRRAISSGSTKRPVEFNKVSSRGTSGTEYLDVRYVPITGAELKPGVANGSLKINLDVIVFAMGLLALSFISRADIAIQATRLVHQGSERMVVQRIWNQGEVASMIQSWIDTGQGNDSPQADRLPFFVTPPLFQLEPGRNRDISVRLVDAASLPRDRESLYWLNILDLPASKKTADAMNISYAVRWRVKLFHRPAGLAGAAEAAPAQLAWRMQKGEAGVVQLRAQNDTPYHINLRELSVGDAEIELDPDSAEGGCGEGALAG
ncbi:hypothetical protein G6F50_013828 [Rhizopus delemar]|uniref:Pili assembly chaperone N-terminal domain-containing protein n=1 Tax=Rhizopus delemar TaxID=936053 RepID=A0A9P6YCB9_9FUNG|nr:hypothetical protein G6F50_013828 [Rhizopus delemar]